MIKPIRLPFKSGDGRQLRARMSERVPYLAVTQEAPDGLVHGPTPAFRVATYNVHRWTGFGGGRKFAPDLAFQVLRELDADIIALQEVLRTFEGNDALSELATRLNYHMAFATTRIHRQGELGNALLSRWPMEKVFAIDLNFGRWERRAALAAQFTGPNEMAVVATHLALVDRTRGRQVRSLLQHPQLQGPALILGDMNAWRRCPASKQLDSAFTDLHHNAAWPPSYPSTRPMLALDRIYARGAHVSGIHAHLTDAARRGSDHLPVVARVSLNGSQ